MKLLDKFISFFLDSLCIRVLWGYQSLVFVQKKLHTFLLSLLGPLCPLLCLAGGFDSPWLNFTYCSHTSWSHAACPGGQEHRSASCR